MYVLGNIRRCFYNLVVIICVYVVLNRYDEFFSDREYCLVELWVSLMFLQFSLE